MESKLQITRAKIKNFYSFNDCGNGELYRFLDDGSKLVFKFFPISDTVDLLLVSPKGEEKVLVFSFTFNNKEDIEILNEWYSKKHMI